MLAAFGVSGSAIADSAVLKPVPESSVSRATVFPEL